MGASVGAPVQDSEAAAGPSDQAALLHVASVATCESWTTPAAVARRLRSALNSAFDILGESPLAPQQVLPFALKAKSFIPELRKQNPNSLSEEVAKDGGVAPSADVMVPVATYVHHAALVYEGDPDVIRQCLRQCGMELVGHSSIVGPGRVAHYIAFNPSEKVVVLALKGTSSMDDVVTDMVADTEPLAGPGSQGPFAHSGFASAARRVVDETCLVLQHAFVSHGYRLVVTGHSLGAGTACCVARLLHDKGIPLQCFAYATPPCLDREAALQAVSYVTSVVHHDDIVPRASIANLKIMGDIVRDFVQKQQQGEEDFGAAVQEALAQKQDHVAGEIGSKHDMYVAGRVVFSFLQAGKYEAAVKDGTLRNLRRIELMPNCMSDHLCSGYSECTSAVANRLLGGEARDFAPWKQSLLCPVAPEDEAETETESD